jgi:hypothetical protein
VTSLHNGVVQGRPSAEQLKLPGVMKNVGQLQVTILVVILALMVLKPGGIVGGR